MIKNVKIEVSENVLNQRLDVLVMENFRTNSEYFGQDFSRGDLAKFIKNGDITVNGKKSKPSYVVKAGDLIEGSIEKKENKLIPDPEIEINVVYEDENIIVVNKQAGISVHPDNKSNGGALTNGLIVKYPEIVDVKDTDEWSYLRPGIVHRLDKDTSGLMIVARNQKAFDELKRKFKDREISKTYKAIVYGKIIPESGVIDKAVARSTSYKRQVIAGKKTKTTVREAVTEYNVLENFGKYSLVELHPKTGRMHQLRIHLFSLDNPIIGDKLYRKRGFLSEDAVRANRQMLHAYKLNFELFGKPYSFVIEDPEDFKETLEKVRS